MKVILLIMCEKVVGEAVGMCVMNSWNRTLPPLSDMIP